MGERAEGLRQTMKRFDNTDSLIMSTREKLLGSEITDKHRPEGEDMHIGDDNSVIHQYLQPQQKGSALGTLAKLGIAAGLMATGVGVPYAGYLVADALKNQPKPAPVIDTDTNTEYEIGLEP